MSRSNANNPERVARIMLSWHRLELVSCTTLQTLWAGYGYICALTVRAITDEAAKHLSRLYAVEAGAAGTTYPLILKLISPPTLSAGNEEEGHLRKMLSYEVEQYFYNHVATHLSDDIAVAKCLVSTRGMGGRAGEEELKGLIATIMIDLRSEFPVAGGKRTVLNQRQVYGALSWLAGFHARSWGMPQGTAEDYFLPPLEEFRRRKTSSNDTLGGIWLNGGYTYLATRRKEYSALAGDTASEWSEALCSAVESSRLSIAEMVALLLTPSGRPIESWIHGDVKSENLFTSTDGDKVAFFDFQYVGRGLGVCDLAKLFTCSVPLHMLVDVKKSLPEQLVMCDGERRLLERYRSSLLHDKHSGLYEWEDFRRHWETALVDWCRFQASWGFWGNTEWLEARVRSILNDGEWRDWLHRNTSTCDGQQ